MYNLTLKTNLTLHDAYMTPRKFTKGMVVCADELEPFVNELILSGAVKVAENPPAPVLPVVPTYVAPVRSEPIYSTPVPSKPVYAEIYETEEEPIL